MNCCQRLLHPNIKMLKYNVVAYTVLAVLVNAKNGEDERVVIHDDELAATSDTDEMVKKVEEQVRAILKNPELKKFKAVSYYTDVPILRTKKRGTSYFVKVNTGDSKAFIILRIFQDIPKKITILHGIKTNQPKNGPIQYFDGNLNSSNEK